MIKLFDTLSGKKQTITKPRGRRQFRMFVCGPTVYDNAHIGHARTYLTFDAFVRYLRSRDFSVFYLQNITDIDDKIIDRARASHNNPEDLARVMERSYLRDMKRLDIIGVNRYARATQFIPKIISQIQTLINKKYAYEIPGSGWYFDISRFKDYGKLSGRTVAQAEDAASRVDEASAKRNKGDFALWKFVSVPKHLGEKETIPESSQTASRRGALLSAGDVPDGILKIRLSPAIFSDRSTTFTAELTNSNFPTTKPKSPSRRPLPAKSPS